MPHADALTQHLAWWGLRQFSSDSDYFRWQRESIPAADLAELTRLAEAKRAAPDDQVAERSFYDFSARPHILPALYSQRYDYYLTLGPLIADRISDARSAVDFGCGVGILTTFYARLFPERKFLGVDHSEASIAVAMDRAAKLGLANVRFQTADIEREPLAGNYDLIVASHALVQAEQDPGLPSRGWETFDRDRVAAAQAAFEQRTGIGPRLDALVRMLAPRGRMLIFEKTRQLARRVPFQRALAARGFALVERPQPLRYHLIGEVVEDGPLYHLTRKAETAVPWDEQPERPETGELFRCSGAVSQAVYDRLPEREALGTVVLPGCGADPTTGASRLEWGRASHGLAYLLDFVLDRKQLGHLFVWPGAAASEPTARLLESLQASPPDAEMVRSLLGHLLVRSGETTDPEHAPLYENRSPGAQAAWETLTDRDIVRQATLREPDGRLTHLEMGRATALSYFYLANTFDQRQIVIMDLPRDSLLEQYFDELLTDARASGAVPIS
jgi:SAM-dependent methyltransferase